MANGQQVVIRVEDFTGAGGRDGRGQGSSLAGGVAGGVAGANLVPSANQAVANAAANASPVSIPASHLPPAPAMAAQMMRDSISISPNESGNLNDFTQPAWLNQSQLDDVSVGDSPFTPSRRTLRNNDVRYKVKQDLRATRDFESMIDTGNELGLDTSGLRADLRGLKQGLRSTIVDAKTMGTVFSPLQERMIEIAVGKVHVGPAIPQSPGSYARVATPNAPTKVTGNAPGVYGVPPSTGGGSGGDKPPGKVPPSPGSGGRDRWHGTRSALSQGWMQSRTFAGKLGAPIGLIAGLAELHRLDAARQAEVKRTMESGEMVDPNWFIRDFADNIADKGTSLGDASLQIVFTGLALLGAMQAKSGAFSRLFGDSGGDEDAQSTAWMWAAQSSYVNTKEYFGLDWKDKLIAKAAKKNYFDAKNQVYEESLDYANKQSKSIAARLQNLGYSGMTNNEIADLAKMHIEDQVVNRALEHYEREKGPVPEYKSLDPLR